MSLFDTSRFVQEIHPLATAAAGLRCHVVGELRSLGGFHWAQTIGSGIVCTHILKGCGTMIKNGRAHAYDEGMTAFSAAGERLEYFDDPGHPWRYVWTWLDGPEAAGAWRRLAGGETLPPRRLARRQELAAALQEALLKAKANAHGEYYGASLAWGILDQLSMELRGGAAAPPLAQACAAYIDGHLSNAPAVEELAERFKASRVTVFREFKREFGVSPKEYIEAVRFRKAASLLADARLGVKEIAHQCGFKDQSHFNYQFKRRFGVPPGQWREGLSSGPPCGNAPEANPPNA